jgi:hypothetical protein
MKGRYKVMMRYLYKRMAIATEEVSKSLLKQASDIWELLVNFIEEDSHMADWKVKIYII